MANKATIHLFGDQAFAIVPQLRDLLQSNQSPLLQLFFTAVYQRIRLEIGSLPASERESFPRFTSIADIVSTDTNQVLFHPALQGALSCTFQLAEFIRQHDHSSVSYPVQSNNYVLGLCTGAISAAAVASSQSVSDLIAIAPDAISVAFKAGLCTLKTRQRITTSSDRWSMVVHSSSPELVKQSLTRFSEANRLPTTSQPWISAQMPHGVTISGPPAVLEQLRGEQIFQKHSITIPIYAPYHASHLYNQSDIDEILSTTSSSPIGQYAIRLSFVSSSNGQIIKADSFKSLLDQALRQVLIEPIQFPELFQGITSIRESSLVHAFRINSIGTNAGPMISSVLKASGISCETPAQIPRAPSNNSPLPSGRSKIAIIGMSGRFPSAEDNQEFWKLLLTGLDVHKEVPSFHWDAKTHVDLTGTKKNTSATPFGCWLEHPQAFDAKFFNMSPREAPQVDPAQRIALMTAYEAIEQAGIVPDATPSTRKDRVGVFYGITSNDWMETNSAQNIDTYFIPGGNRAFVPGRINYFFKFSGPSYSVDTACSSSLAAIHVACNSLWSGDIDTAIAGGTNVLTNPDFTAGLDRGHFLSRTGNCKTFDDGADGYCHGEGVGTVILKRLEDAIADNDPIQALILGAYTNHSAEAESITRPHIGAQKAIFSKVLNDAGVDPYSVSYVEMHGTGTQAGDAREMSSVLETFAPSPDTRSPRTSAQRLHLGSAKANIGHGEAASGVSSLAKVLLMLQNKVIPPHCGIKTRINSKFPTDLVERNVHIAKEAVPWDSSANQPRRVFINNFSAAGGNSALLIEDRPAESLQTPRGRDPRIHHVVSVTAKTSFSLSSNLASLLSHLNSATNEIDLAQLSYTTTARRMHHLHRVLVSGSSILEIQRGLEKAIVNGDGANRPKSIPKITFAFTGQGGQHPGMAKYLFDHYSVFRKEIQNLDRLGQGFGFPAITPYFQDDSNNQTRHYQPLVFQLATVAMQIALSQLWASWGIQPDAVIGHSLGEYSALNVAGVLSDADVIFLVGKRGELLERQCTQNTHSMLVVRAPISAVSAILSGITFETCCLNGPEETVIGGIQADVLRLRDVLTAHGLKTTLLNVPFAYHSSQMDCILEDLELVAKSVHFAKPKIPVISTLLAEIVMDEKVFGPLYIRNHCRQPVKFLDSVVCAQKQGLIQQKSIVVEMGPHPILTRLVKSALGEGVVTLPSLHRNQDPLKVITESISQIYRAGKDFDWQEYHRDFKTSHVVLRLPAYNWQLKNYWMQYVNDWSLRKGDPPLILSAPKLESTTIHKVLEESAEKIVVESDICREDLNPLVKGHVVDNIPLCTPSVYADIALTLGNHLIERYHPELKDCQIDVTDMTIHKALIAKSEGPQLVQTIVDIDWVNKKAKCRFATLDKDSKPTYIHAQCVIHFTDQSWYDSLRSDALNMRKRMDGMRAGIESGVTQRFNRTMVYKMIKPLAQFHEEYRALNEVVINSDTLEASSRISFETVKPDGNYHTHPAYIDALSQSGGFVMNCHDANDLDKEVFVNHGWDSFQLYKPLDPQKSYSTFVQMFEEDGRIFKGNLVVFEGATEEIVASYKNICLQGIPRRLLRHVLSVEAKRNPQAPKASAVSTISKPIVAKATKVASIPSSQVRIKAATKNSESDAILVQTAKITESPSFKQALSIISEESGVATDELSDDTIFSDIGIDSLLSLVITSRFREELNVDLTIDDFFSQYPTVAAFKEYLSPLGAVAEAPIDVALIEPELEQADPVIDSDVTPDIDDEGSSALFQSALAIISQESGISIAELTDECIFSDIGIDSLLSLVIVSRFREELGHEIEVESVFTDFPTVGDLRRLLMPVPSTTFDETSSQPSSSGDDAKGMSSGSSQTSMSDKDECPTPDPCWKPVPPASSVLLQGLPKSCRITLFLFPDGAGSATSYSGIPRVASDIALVGLNSPFYRNPADFRCGVDDLIDSYLTEVRRRQPQGPYHFGGWSAGGILAYRAAQRLIDAGESVARLVLIDSPVPKGLEKLPQHFYDFCSDHQIFGHSSTGSTTPEWLIPHFNATIDALHDYFASPMPTGKTPSVSLLWATECVIDGVNVPKLPPHPDDTEGMKFLTEKRTDFSGNGWERLFPGRQIRIERAHGVNHFGMMRGPFGSKLAHFIQESLD